MPIETPHRDSDKPLVSMAYWSVVESVLRDNGIERDWMTQHPGLALGRQTGRLRCKDYESLLLLSLEAFGPALGMEAGLRGYPTKHGPLGVAFMSCASLAEAMQLGMRYHHTRMPYYDMHIQQHGEWIWVDVHERLAIEGLRQFGMTSALVEIITLIRTLAHVPKEQLQLYFDMPEPAYFKSYQDKLPPTTFNWPVNRMAIHVQALTARPPSANAQALREACAQCDAELVRLGLAGSWRERVIARLQDHTSPQAPAPRTIEQMAQALFVSERTLKRHLQREGCTFKSLQDAARLRAAQALLASPDIAIADIAHQIGFDDPAHFTRAFKRWTGDTPSVVRARLNA